MKYMTDYQLEDTTHANLQATGKDVKRFQKAGFGLSGQRCTTKHGRWGRSFSSMWGHGRLAISIPKSSVSCAKSGD